jgi:hypothetical protein
MPDMSICTGNDCPLKDSCYRYKAKAGEYMQSYIEAPYNVEEAKCDFYWPTKQLKNGKDKSII